MGAMRRCSRLLLIALLLPAAAVLISPASAEDAPTTTAAKPAIDAERLMAHVRWMAAPERKGRGAWPDREATAAYIAKAFAEAGLKVLPGRKDMFQDKAGLKEPALRNVVAWLPPPPEAKGEYVILSSHYDHLGQKVTVIKDGETETRVSMTFAGADDNASGVAVLLEIARVLGAKHKADPTALGRGVVFVAFDLEEQNLIGSQDYVKRTPLPLDGCAAFLTMDMLGRSLADLIPGSLFVMGTENSAALDALVRKQPEPTDGERIILGIDFQPGYSDYVPFKDAKIPYIFLTSGACADYHRATDVVARIQPEHLVARTTWVRRLVSELLELEQRPTWRGGAEPSVEEVKILQKTLTVVAKKLPDIPGIPPQAEPMVKNFLKFIEGVLADGAVTEQERRSVRNTTLMLFRFAQSAGGGR